MLNHDDKIEVLALLETKIMTKYTKFSFGKFDEFDDDDWRVMFDELDEMLITKYIDEEDCLSFMNDLNMYSNVKEALKF